MSTHAWSAAALLLASTLAVAIPVANGGAPDSGGRAQLAWEVQARRAFEQGSLPIWNPYQFGGQPHLADPRTLGLYPPHVVLRPLPLALFFPVSVILHVWLAGVGAYMVGRQTGLSSAAAVFGAFGLIAVLVPTSAAAHSVDVYAVAWLPLVIAGALRSAVRQGMLPGPLLVASLSLALLTGSARAALYAVGAAAAVYAWAVCQPPASRARRECLVQLAAACVLAAGLAAFLTLPAAHVRMASGGLLAYDDPASREDGLAARTADPIERQIEPALETALEPLRGHRTVAACEQVIDASQLTARGIPVAGGAGGVYSAEYARVINLTRAGTAGIDPVYRGMSGIGDRPVSDRLLDLLGVEYLVTCEPADPGNWSLVTQVDDVGIYRNDRASGRAFWTCPPAQVTRVQAESALSGLGRMVVHVRWAPAVDDDRRATMESSLRLRPLQSLGDRTWQYELANASREQLAAIVGNPDVEDTHGIDRGSLTVAESGAAPSGGAGEPSGDTGEWLLAEGCSEQGRATPLDSDRADGTVAIDVDAPRDGVVVLAEPYYAVRTARVDGRTVTPLKVDLAFTAVPVPAGTHLVELVYDRSWIRAGAGVSFASLAVWAAIGLRARVGRVPRMRTRRPPQSPITNPESQII